MAVSRRGNFHTRLDRLEAMTPPPSGSPEARARMVEAVETLKDLILENGDEINADYKERIGRGEEHLDALIAAKQAVWERTVEGRAALDVLGAVRDRGGEVQAMSLCSGIRADGGRCKAQAIRGAEWCVNHHPDYEGARRRRNSKGGKRGGRGRPTGELARLGARFEELADKVLAGEVDRAAGAVAGQLLNGARACVRDGLTAREQEELVERLDALEEGLQGRKAG